MIKVKFVDLQDCCKFCKTYRGDGEWFLECQKLQTKLDSNHYPCSEKICPIAYRKEERKTDLPIYDFD